MAKKPDKKKPVKKPVPAKAAKPAKKPTVVKKVAKVVKKVQAKAPVAKKAAKVVVKKVASPKKVAKPAPVKVVPVKAAVKKVVEAKEPVKKAEKAPVPVKVAKKETPKQEELEEAAIEPVEVASADESEGEEESEEIVLTDAEGRRYCRVKDCDQLASVDGYCRYHYLLYWKKIQVRKKILSEGKLERYVEELTARYPDKFLEMLRKDLRSEKEFLAAIQELEIDESAMENELEDETQTYIDEVRGMAEPGGREEEDF